MVPRTYPEDYLHRYRIEGCANIDNHPCYKDPYTEPGFQQLLGKFKDMLLSQAEDRDGVTYYKYGDGDRYFLCGIPEGSATPGRRALSKPYSEIGLERFRSLAQLCSFYTCELYPENRQGFSEVLSRKIDFPAEFSYGLVANKWLLKTFAGRVGLLGGAEKLKQIHDLVSHSEYQEYLGLERFNDYITIPEKFACDNLDQTISHVASQLQNANPETRIFLVGVGHVKSGLLSCLPDLRRAVYLDVGTGMNMLAGCVSHYRPYAADWTNYGLLSQAASMDLMDFKDGRGVERWL